MTRFAENSSTEAMISLGDMYYFGHDTIANVALAIKWYRRAADMNSVEAMYTLAYIYKPPTNNKWYSKAVSNHEFLNELDKANNALMGDTYYFGRHGVQNHDLAIKYYKQSADAPSMHNLGVIYERIREDKLESIQWYKKGHEQGYASSTFNLSQLYYAEKNYEKVFELCIEIATPTSQTSHNPQTLNPQPLTHGVRVPCMRVPSIALRGFLLRVPLTPNPNPDKRGWVVRVPLKPFTSNLSTKLRVRVSLRVPQGRVLPLHSIV
jgi:hypothetical protein